MKHLKWDQRQFHTFKTRYKQAVKQNLTSFIFEHDEFLTAYAKYLIEYLESLESQQ